MKIKLKGYMHDVLQIFVQIYSFKFFIIYIIIVIIAINSLHILFRSTQSKHNIFFYTHILCTSL